jgi:opacity protein-like surface antigen
MTSTAAQRQHPTTWARQLALYVAAGLAGMHLHNQIHLKTNSASFTTQNSNSSSKLAYSYR